MATPAVDALLAQQRSVIGKLLQALARSNDAFERKALTRACLLELDVTLAIYLRALCGETVGAVRHCAEYLSQLRARGAASDAKCVELCSLGDDEHSWLASFLATFPSLYSSEAQWRAAAENAAPATLIASTAGESTRRASHWLSLEPEQLASLCNSAMEMIERHRNVDVEW